MELWSSPKAARNTEAGYFLHAVSRKSEVNSCLGSRHGRAQNFKLDTTINKEQWLAAADDSSWLSKRGVYCYTLASCERESVARW